MEVQYGITAPISLSGPTDHDIEQTKNLEVLLQEHGLYETEEESKRREIILGRLNMIVKQFVKTVCISQKLKGYTEEMAEQAGGKIFTFGSYRLGVHGSGADIDTLCVVPQNVERHHFFSIFVEELKSIEDVSELTAVAEAYVPVIKMRFGGIPIDLLFAKLAMASIPEDLDLSDNGILRNIDEKCILSLNGSRVADQIVKLVPNITTFHTALRCIKLWAKKRAIYSNAVGYLGGVAWALMIARICQVYPNAAASLVVTRFFSIYYQWKWPSPVMLKPIEDGPLAVWDPRVNQGDRNHRMPVITPAYPSMCSTHNVCASTLGVMTAEFLRGSQITLNIEHGKATWVDLFAKSDFFYRYKIYLRVTAAATNEENHRMWVGLVESRLRMLVAKLEMVPGIESCPPYPYGFETKVNGCTLDEALENKPPADESNIKAFHITSFYIGLCIQLKPDLQGNNRKLVIDRPVTDFKRMLVAWERCNEDMTLQIKNIKRSDLPDEVYDGAPRPAKLKRSKNSSERPAKKIAMNEISSEISTQATNDTPSQDIATPENFPTTPVETVAVNLPEIPAPVEDLTSLHAQSKTRLEKKREIMLTVAKT